MVRCLPRIFRRKEAPAAPAVHDRRQPNDWKAGDLAVCIVPTGQWFPGHPADPAEGELLRVKRVYDEVGNYPDGYRARSYFLTFETKPESGWEVTGFRKPIADAEPAEDEFTALIRRPVREPVS